MSTAAGQAYEDIILNGKDATDVVAGLGKMLAQATLKAAQLGEGPLAGLMGTADGGGMIRGTGTSDDIAVMASDGTLMVAKVRVLQTSGVTVNLATGTVTFAAAPGVGKALKWGGQFHVPVRFDGKLDQIELQGAFEIIAPIPQKEVRL